MQLTALFALALVSVAAAAPTQLTGRATQNIYTIHPNGDTTKCEKTLSPHPARASLMAVIQISDAPTSRLGTCTPSESTSRPPPSCSSSPARPSTSASLRAADPCRVTFNLLQINSIPYVLP
ncbi:hypothetical protein C8F04DRAFT_1106011 [Mycena alexandri]|uniref:Uncharacterized protein n=1 Tax=Mycena alexandri TaxID=1745969 RepID=A0AAD6SW55_9AGAR|nr:hypothetical protein C8F04DRAFT_1106011 [Mycena alexandri]